MKLYEKLLAKICFCPECRSQMKEAQRREENGSIFIWFECSKPDCRGQWLQRIPAIKKRVAI
jgi:hypothetical protein